MFNIDTDSVIRFSIGEPSKEYMSPRLLEHLQLLKSDTETFYPYSEKAGLLGAREAFIERWGTPFSHPDKCLITHGTLGALELITRVYKPNVILIDEPCFAEALSVFRAYGAQLKNIPRTDGGVIDFERLKAIIETIPRIGIYLVPTLNNPDARCLGLDERKRIAEICLATGILCIEDAVYQELLFDRRPMESIYELTGNRKHHLICRIMSLSKMVMPGLRVAFLEASPAFFKELVNNKLDYGFSPVVCCLAEKLLKDRLGIEENLSIIKSKLKEGISYLRQLCIENDFQVNNPLGGYFLWLQFNYDLSGDLLQKASKMFQVDFTLGNKFYLNTAKTSIRLSVGQLSRGQMKEGIVRLKNAISWVEKNQNRCLLISAKESKCL